MGGVQRGVVLVVGWEGGRVAAGHIGGREGVDFFPGGGGW